MTSPVASVADLARQSAFDVIDCMELPSRSKDVRPVPVVLADSVRRLLETRFVGGLYRHQAMGIEKAIEGQDVCVATSTASGKSLVFIAVAAHMALSRGGAKTLALYPAKALIQDQLGKWREILDPLGLRLGFIDGSVASGSRPAILEGCDVVLMTPDVTHAWLMSRVSDPSIREFLDKLGLLVLDEAHAYDGAFGTNMAYLLRRLDAVAEPFQIISSTATLGEPDAFIEQLTGRKPFALAAEDDGSGAARKTLFLLQPSTARLFEQTAVLLSQLKLGPLGRFLVFGDSRKLVEHLVAATHRSRVESPEESETAKGEAEDGEEEDEEVIEGPRILPFRAGYEEEDRQTIQRALATGELAGVVSTSALELGIDIGDIQTVVLVGRPPSMNSFWQRLGRAGRRGEGVCLMLQEAGSSRGEALEEHVRRPLEPNRLYLANRYIQYSHALCAATEASGDPARRVRSFSSLPPAFLKMLENELNPSEAVPADLYPLKQLAQNGPQYVFPLRTAVEKNFQIETIFQQRLGTVTLGQALREAYPGAVYYYMARPYRVHSVNFHHGEIRCRRERRYTTQPIAQSKVFPRFRGGMLRLRKSDRGFIAEVEMQASERVVGFVERRGQNRTTYAYGPGSLYSQRELNRFIQTTGVCWSFSGGLASGEDVAAFLMLCFAEAFGIQSRDLGSGLFYSRVSPEGPEPCAGACVYDSTHGSLRLTQELADHFVDVVALALDLAQKQELALTSELEALLERARDVALVELREGSLEIPRTEGDVAIVVAAGERAMHWAESGQVREVRVLGVRYTPAGLLYDLAPDEPGTKWQVAANKIQAIAGETRMERLDLMTGERSPLE